MGQPILITSEDQSMWASGDAPKWTWDSYLPLIGGDLTEWTATGVSVQGRGVSATIVGDEVHFTANARALGKGVHTVVIEVELQGTPRDDGTIPTTIREVEVEVTVARTQVLTKKIFSVTEMKSSDADAAWKGSGFSAPQKTLRFDAVGAEDGLASPHSFTGDGPAEVIDINIDLAQEVRAVAKGVIDALDDPAGVLRLFAKGLADKIGLTAVAETTAAAFKATADTLKVAWDFAKDKVPALQGVEAAGEVALAAVVGAAEAAKDAATDAVLFAQDKLNDLLDFGKRLINKITDKIEDGFSGLVGWLFDKVDNAVDKSAPTDDELQQIEQFKAEVKQEVQDQRKAEKALDAAKALADHLGDKTVGQAATALAEAEAAKQEAIDALKSAFAGRDKALWQIDNAVANLDTGNKLATGTIDQIFGSVIDAAAKLNPMRLVNDALSNSNFILQLKALVNAEAQAGLKLSAVIDSGSVDSRLLYDVTSTIDGNPGSDSYTFVIDAVNTDDTTNPAFETQSPYVSFSADILYEVSGSIELTFDMLATAAGAVMIDVPTGSDPFRWTKELQDSGSFNLLEIDSRNIEIEIAPPALEDILTVKFRLPNVQTEGTRTDDWRDEYNSEEKISFAEFVKQSYDDPSPFDLAGLGNRLLNLVTPEIGFSETFQKFLDDNDTTIDVTSDNFADALVKALGIIVDAVVDIRLTKADGSTFAGDDENPYKDDDGYMPIFQITNKADGNDGLIHLDLFDNPTFDGDLAMVEKLGFFTASGRTMDAAGNPANFLDVTVDVDQLIATAINVVVLGNPPDTTINPLDLSYSLEDIFGDKKDKESGTGTGGTDSGAEEEDEVDSDLLAEFLNLEAGVELADLDVNAGAYLSQKFVLSVEDMEYRLLVEGTDAGTFSASGGGTFTLANASSYTDKNGNGQIDYELRLVPKAEFFNDTQLGLNLGYQLDLLKEKLEFTAKLPAHMLTGILSHLGLPTGVDVSVGLGPLLRLDGQIDLLSADVFESAFDFNAGFGSIFGVLPAMDDRSDFTLGTEGDDVMGTAGNDRLDLLGGNDRGLGGPGDDVIYGGAGNDLLYSGTGNDLLDGEAGNDKIVGQGGNNTLRGGAGNDTLEDGSGADLIQGGEGNDLLTSLNGADTIEGGAGNDMFIFSAPRTAGAMAGSPLVFIDFDVFDLVTQTGDRLRTSQGFNEAVYASLEDVEGPDVLVKFAVAPKLASGQSATDYAALVAGGRQVLFKDMTVDQVTTALELDRYVLL